LDNKSEQAKEMERNVMKKSLKYILFAAGIASATQFSMLAAMAQSSVTTNNAEPDFLAPASDISIAAAAAAQSQAGTSAAQGSQGNVTQSSGANEFHTQVLNPTAQQNVGVGVNSAGQFTAGQSLGLNRTGTANLAPIFGF
jgi:hypothetical protein